MAVQYRTSIFDKLVAQMRGDVEYFRHKCPEANSLLAVAMKPIEFRVWTQPPYSSSVQLVAIDARITYRKELRKNPRAKPQSSDGQFVVKVNYSQSVWLEHQGEPIELADASRLLLSDLFQTVAEPER